MNFSKDNDPLDFASQRYEREVEELLYIMDEANADVDDDMAFSDFYYQHDGRWLEVKDTISKTYDIEIDIDECLWEAAEKIRNASYGE